MVRCVRGVVLEWATQLCGLWHWLAVGQCEGVRAEQCVEAAIFGLRVHSGMAEIWEWLQAGVIFWLISTVCVHAAVAGDNAICRKVLL